MSARERRSEDLQLVQEAVKAIENILFVSYSSSETAGETADNNQVSKQT